MHPSAQIVSCIVVHVCGMFAPNKKGWRMEQHEKQQFETMVVSDAEPQICATEKKLESVSVQAPSVLQSKPRHIIHMTPPLIALVMFCCLGTLSFFTAGQQDQLADAIRNTYIPSSSTQTPVFANETLDTTSSEVFDNEKFEKEFEDLLNRYNENLKDIAQKSAAAQNNGGNGGNNSQPR